MWQTKIMVNHFTRLLRKPMFSQLENRRFSNSSSACISRIDRKGRIFIPIRLRAKLRLLEGTDIVIAASDGCLIVFPNGQKSGGAADE
ncbi:MAG: MraZ N-terminal domain containing protein [Candidatus Aenigmarchaeota archaeon]|nr:MraZ N-terminal domain containing protein [Candidatus Aenigmarchaeota archaeon]